MATHQVQYFKSPFATITVSSEIEDGTKAQAVESCWQFILDACWYVYPKWWEFWRWFEDRPPLHWQVLLSKRGPNGTKSVDSLGRVHRSPGRG